MKSTQNRRLPHSGLVIKAWVTIPLLLSISQMLETIIIGTAIYSTERKHRFIGVCISGDSILFHLKLWRRCKNGNNRQQYRPSRTLYSIETSSAWAIWGRNHGYLVSTQHAVQIQNTLKWIVEKNYGVWSRKQCDMEDEIMRHYRCNPKWVMIPRSYLRTSLGAWVGTTRGQRSLSQHRWYCSTCPF